MNFLQKLTDKVATKKGAWITVIAWLVIMILISAGPKLGEYKVTNFQSLPDDAQSLIAQNKLDELFPNDKGTPGIYVFHNPDGELVIGDVNTIIEGIKDANIEGIEEILDVYIPIDPPPTPTFIKSAPASAK